MLCFGAAALFALPVFLRKSVVWESLYVLIPGIAISAWVAVTGGRLVLNGVRVLVDETVSQDDLDTIRDTLESPKPAGVISYHRLRARRSGAVRHVDVHVVVDPQMTVAEAHVITDRIEASLEDRLPSADVVVHVEPAGSEPEPDALD
jgi:ferrous-iron efflux pump FieF